MRYVHSSGRYMYDILYLCTTPGQCASLSRSRRRPHPGPINIHDSVYLYSIFLNDYLRYICHEQSGNLRNLQIALHNLGISRLCGNLRILRLLKYDPIWWLEQSEDNFLHNLQIVQGQSADRSGAICRLLRCDLQIAQLSHLQIAQVQFADRSGAICRSRWVNPYMCYMSIQRPWWIQKYIGVNQSDCRSQWKLYRLTLTRLCIVVPL